MLKRKGFTLLEAIMVVGLMAIIAAVVVPVTAGHADDEAISSTLDIMLAVEDTIGVPDLTAAGTFGKVVGALPGTLSVMGEPTFIATDINSCGAAFAGAQQNAWLGTSAPWLWRAVSRSRGIGTPIGVIENRLVRKPVSASAGTLSMVMLNLPYEYARRMNDIIDGTAEAFNADGSQRTNKIQMSAMSSTNRTVDTLYYVMTITVAKC